MEEDKRIDTSGFVTFMKRANTPEGRGKLRIFLLGFFIGGVIALLYVMLLKG